MLILLYDFSISFLIPKIKYFYHIQNEGKTALHKAAENGQTEIVKYLLDSDIFFNASDKVSTESIIPYVHILIFFLSI